MTRHRSQSAWERLFSYLCLREGRAINRWYGALTEPVKREWLGRALKWKNLRIKVARIVVDPQLQFMMKTLSAILVALLLGGCAGWPVRVSCQVEAADEPAALSPR